MGAIGVWSGEHHLERDPIGEHLPSLELTYIS
jgi:hypothetical protein